MFQLLGFLWPLNINVVVVQWLSELNLQSVNPSSGGHR